MPLPDIIILSLIGLWYALIIAFIIYREIRAAKHKRLHVNKYGRLVKDAYRTGFSGKAPVFNEQDMYK